MLRYDRQGRQRAEDEGQDFDLWKHRGVVYVHRFIHLVVHPYSRVS